MPRVYVSIGSNIERDQNVRSAVRALRARFGRVEVSPVYESPADGFTGDDFYNLVAGFETEEPLETVAGALGAIEAAHGRVRNVARYGPRTLDIDVLLYGDLIRHDGTFDIPRRDILTCDYVLRPLAELAPELRHPETGERIKDLWQRQRPGRQLRAVTIAWDDAGAMR